MADDPNERWAEHNPLIGPGPTHQPEPAPPRSWGAAVVDTGLDLGASVVGAGRQVLGAVEGLGSAIDTNAPGTVQARTNLDTAADLETSIKGYRSEARQQVDREGGYSFGTDPGKYLLGAGIGMLPYAPLALLGPAGVPAAAALGFGQVRSDERESIRQAPLEEIRKNPQYVDFRDQGLSDAEARERLAVESTDPRKAQTWLNAAPNMAGQALTSGFGSAVIKGLGMPAMRGIKTGIVERVIEATNKSFIRGRATGVGMGVGAGAALGGGADLSRQLSAQTSGMQQGPVEWGKVGEAAGETAALFGPLGLGYRRPERFRGAPKVAAPPIGVDTEHVARDMSAGDLGGVPGPWGERPVPEGEAAAPATGGERPMEHGDLGMPRPFADEYGPEIAPPGAGPWGGRPPPPGPEMRPTDIGADYPGTGREDIAALRRQQREMGGMPAITDLGGPRRMRDVDIERQQAAETPMAPEDLAPRDAFGGEYGYPEAYPREGARRKGAVPLDEADLARVPTLAEGYPGLEEASVRTTPPPVPKRGSTTFTGEPEVHAPPGPPLGPERPVPPTKRMPQEGPQFPEVEAPGLPGAGDFPHEGAAAPSPWRQGGPGQQRIAEHMAGANIATRGQIAAMLQAGARRVADLPKAVQRTLSKVADIIDRGLEYDRESTIETIRGGAKEVGVRERLDADEHTAVAALRDKLNDDEFSRGLPDVWGNRIAAAAGTTHGKIAMGVLPKSLNDALNALPEDQRAQVKSALRTNAREVADVLRGKDYKPIPGEWIHEDAAAPKETKAKAQVEGDVDVLTKVEPAAGHGPREAVAGDIEQPAPVSKGRPMVARDIHPAPEKLTGEHLKKEEPLKGLAGLKQAIEKKATRTQRAARFNRSARLVTQRAAVAKNLTGEGESMTTVEHPTVLVTGGYRAEGPKRAAPPSTAPTRPPKVLPTLPQTPAMRALIRKRQMELLAMAERAEEAAKHASGPKSRAAFEQAAEARRREANELLAERTTQADLERRARYEEEDAKTTAEGERLWEQLYGKMEDMLRQARLKYEKANKDPKVAMRETDAQRKAEERKPTYTMKDQIAGNILKVPDAAERQAEVEKLDDIVTGKAEGTTTTVQTEQVKRARRGAAVPYRLVDEKSALLPSPVNFITASRDGLLRIAKALVERAREKIADAEKGFVNDHERRLAEGSAGWNIALTVGRNRGPHGIYYNHLVTYKRFIRAVNEFKGSPDMLRTMILNHYMGERLVMEGKAHKLDEFHKEQIDFLRQLAKERYNSVKADGTRGEIALAEKAYKAFNRELDDVIHTESLDEVHHSVVDQSELFDLLEHEGIKPGAIDQWGSVRLAQFVDQHNKDLLEHLTINERRKVEGKREIQPYDRQMSEIYGDRWFDADDTARTDMINERAMLDELGGKGGEAYRPVPDAPATGPRTFAIDGRPEAGRPREMVVADIQQGLREQLAYLNDGKPLGPTGRAYRIQKLVERAEHLYDQMETIPEKARDPKLQDELRLIEDEIRQHYEDANPKARNVEYGIGQVLENASDLSKPDNLPKGAYVRRVSDFLKEGSRDIRKSVGGLMYGLRQHLLKVADAAVGNMEIVALKPEQMRLAAEARGLPGDTPAFYDRKTHRIIVSQEVLNSPNRAKILGHEITHPLTLRAMEMFPAMRKRIENDLQTLRDAYRDLRNPKYDELRRVMDEDPQAMNNVHEFLAQLYNDGGKTAWALQQIDVPPPTRAQEIWRRGGIWNALKATLVTIRGGLNDLLFKISKDKALNNALLNSLDMFRRMEEAGEFRRPSARGEAMPHAPGERAGAEAQWHERITQTMGGLPAVRAGFVRLFRIEPVDRPKLPTELEPEWLTQMATESGGTAATGRWYATDPAELSWYARHAAENGTDVAMRYVDVPTAIADRYRVSGMSAEGAVNPRAYSRRPEAEHFISRELAGKSVKVDIAKGYDVLPYTSPTGAHAKAVRGRTAEEKISGASELWKDTAFRLKRLGLSGGVLKASTFVDMRRRAEQGMQDMVKGVEDHYSKIETLGKNLFRTHGAEDISHAIAAEMRMPPAVFQKLQDYVSLENHYRVSGSEPLFVGRNAWVSKDSPYHKHYRDRWKVLNDKWNRELTPAQREVRTRALDFYEKQHGRLLDQNLRTTIALREMVPGDSKPTTDALMKHIMREELTDADKTKLEAIGWRREGDTADMTAAQVKFKQQVGELRSSPLFKKVQGAWYPSERRGQWAVHGRYDLSAAAAKHGGRKVDDNGHEWEFDTDAKAQAFYNEVTTDTRYGGIHHEGTTQHVYQANPDGSLKLGADGKPIPETEYSERTTRRGEPGVPGYTETTTGAHRKVSAKAAEGAEGVVTRHRVEFNPLLIEFYEKEREAFERHEELQGDDALKLTDLAPVRDSKGTYLDPKKASRTMAVMIDALERSDAWRTMSEGQRRMARRDLDEAAARHIMSVSARSQRIPKRYALGADKSFLRDFTTYARNTSMTLAEGHHRPGLSKSLSDMDAYVKRNEHSTGTGDEASQYGTLRKKLQTEVYNRVFSRPSDIVAPFWNKFLARVLQLSYMDKLMSPGFVVLNASEPWVLGAPLLAGHHGFKAYAEIGRAYSTLGFGGMWAKGLGDAYKAAREGTMARFEDSHVLLRDRIKGEADGKQLQALMDYGAERGYLDRDAGMELAQNLDPAGNPITKGMDYLDNISRQINQQVENVNRGVIAIAAYRLAVPKMGHEKAMQHAFEMVHDTSGNYGHWNTPAMFNDPRLKFALQFKRYSQRITANYMRMFAGAFARMPSEQRTIARKQLGIMFGSQILLSGTLGLPTEPLKLALLATSPITGFGPDEAEIWAREAAAKVIGNDQLAEGVMRGFPRAYLDIGIGTRIAHDSLWTHGTLGKKPDNWFALIGHTVAGAPGSYLADVAMGGMKTADAMGNLARGNTTQAMADGAEAAGLILPFKIMSDTLAAGQNYLGGPKTMTPAGQPLGYQPNFGQAVMEAAGIRSGTQQEASDKRFALTQAKAAYTQFRTKALQMYVHASTPAEQRAIEERAIAKSKEDWPRDRWLNKGDFLKAKHRFATRQSADPEDVGVMLGKKDAGLRERFSFFNN